MSSILDKPSIRHAALPITVEQYHRLGEQAIISEQTELLRGVIIEQMTKSPLHTYVVQLLVRKPKFGGPIRTALRNQRSTDV